VSKDHPARCGARAGNHTRCSEQAVAGSLTSSTCSTSTAGEIPLITGHRPLFINNDQLFSWHRGERCRAASTVCQCCSRQSPSHRSALRELPLHRLAQKPDVHITSINAPSLYVLNDAALSKPGAVEHLTTDLANCGSDVAMVTERHFKSKHADSATAVDGYTVFRRDRVGRRGGGVAIYARSHLQASGNCLQVLTR